MKRIKQIIAALRVLSRTPSTAIAKAVDEVMAAARAKVDSAGIAFATEEDIVLVENILAAVCDLAADMEKPAKRMGDTVAEDTAEAAK